MVVRRKSEAHPICFTYPPLPTPLFAFFWQPSCRARTPVPRVPEEKAERALSAGRLPAEKARFPRQNVLGKTSPEAESRRRPVASHARNPALLSLPTSARARWLPVLGMGHAFEHTVHSTLTQGVMGASLRSYTGVFSKWLHNVLVPERLRGLTRNQLGLACAFGTWCRV